MIINKQAEILASITKEQWDAILRLGQQINLDTETKVLEPKTVEEPQALEGDLETRVRKLLKKLSIPANLLGYKYLTDAVIMVYEAESYIHNVTKELYPEISRRYQETPQRVERSIRHALEKAYEAGDICIMQEIFGNMAVKQTNSSSIASIVEYLKMNNNK